MGVCVGKSSHREAPSTQETPKTSSTPSSSSKTTTVVEQEPPKEIKLLLLGAGESGKSTVWKQMKMIHVEGFDDNERDEFYKPAVVENVVQLLHGLLQLARKNNVAVSDEHQEIITELSGEMLYDNVKTPILYPKLLALWEDKGIQEVARTFISQLSLDLVDTAPYWLDNYKRILANDFSPTVEDIIKCRTKTTGIADLLFEMDGVEFRLIDVGGQRSERKKWISCFQNLTAILFVVALSEFDQKLREDSDVNRMHESMKLFRGVVANEALHHVHMILFFNKDDIFKKKIQTSKLRDTFPEYDGPEGDYNAAYDFIKNKFTSMNTNPDRTIHTQITVATDIENIRSVMDQVKDILIGKKSGGM